MHTPPHDYEERDLPYKTVYRWIGGLVIGLFAVMVAMFLIFGFPGRVLDPSVVLKRTMTQPPLQPRPWVDMREFKKAQTTQLSTYGWVDRSAGTVRIPIERAMDLVLERGLPARGDSANEK